MHLKDLQQQIANQTLAPIYIVTGEEVALLERARQLFVGLVPDNERDMNLGQYDLADTPLKIILEEAMSVPFFGERRVILVQQPQFLTASGKLTDAEQEALLAIFNQPNDQVVLVFFAQDLKIDKRKKVTKALFNVAQHLDLPLLDERQSQQAIAQFLAKRHITIEPEAQQAFTARTNASYSAMLQEMPKLIAYAQDDKIIDLHAVEALVPKTLHANVFDMVEAVLAQRAQVALQIYHDLIGHGEAPIRINAALLGQFRLLLQVAGLRGGDQEVGQQLKVHWYRVKLARQVLQQYDAKVLRKGYLGALDIDIQLKSTSRDPNLLFETFVLDFMAS